MVRKPESRSFLGKAGFEKRDLAKRLGFFIDGKKRTGPGICKILTNHCSSLLRVISSFQFTDLDFNLHCKSK